MSSRSTYLVILLPRSMSLMATCAGASESGNTTKVAHQVAERCRAFGDVSVAAASSNALADALACSLVVRSTASATAP